MTVKGVIKKMPGQAGHEGKVLGAKAGLKSLADFLKELK